MSGLVDALNDRVLLCDGAMGTQLQLAGLESGGCGEAWNLDHPDRVEQIQRAYVNAGADCVITNTFGASRIMLERHGEARVWEINLAGVRIARRAFDDHPGFVLGGIGPFGGILAPLGEGDPDEVRAAFVEQAAALVQGGVDAIIIETQTALEELEIAVCAAQQAGPPAVIASLAYDKFRDSDEVRTMMGVGPERAASFLVALGVDVIAFNCGADVDIALGASIVERLRDETDLPIMAQPNAGTPVLENLQTVYRQTPSDMAAGVPGLVAAGAGIVGGCCGSTPAHIAAFRAVLETL